MAKGNIEIVPAMSILDISKLVKNMEEEQLSS
jgi:hypothetical protein